MLPLLGEGPRPHKGVSGNVLFLASEWSIFETRDGVQGGLFNGVHQATKICVAKLISLDRGSSQPMKHIDPDLISFVENDGILRDGVSSRLEKQGLRVVPFSQASPFKSELGTRIKRKRPLPFAIILDMALPPSYSPKEGLGLVEKMYGSIIKKKVAKDGHPKTISHLTSGIPGIRDIIREFSDIPADRRPTVLIFSLYVVSEMPQDPDIRAFITEKLIEAGIESDDIIPKMHTSEIESAVEKLISRVLLVRRRHLGMLK